MATTCDGVLVAAVALGMEWDRAVDQQGWVAHAPIASSHGLQLKEGRESQVGYKPGR